jgi:hypothetical protein
MATHNDTPPPDLLALSDLVQKDRIQILLAEYTALRAEIVSRTGYGFQLTLIGVAIVTWVLREGSPGAPWYFWLGVATLVAGFGLGMFTNVRDLKRAAHRVKDLEHEINSRAGEHLLVWEHLSGVVTRMGLIRSFFSPVKPFPRSALPPLDRSYLERDSARHESQ